MKTEYKFTIQQYEINNCLNIAKHAVAAKPAIPILDCLKIEVNTTGRYITVKASDLSTFIEARSNPDSLEPSSDFPWALCIPAKTLISLVALLPDGPVSFTYTTHNRHLTLECLGNHYSFGGENPDDFPKIPAMPNPQAMVLDVEVINTAIDHTAYCTSSDPAKPQMNGLFLGASQDRLTVVATDAKKLVRYINTDVTIKTDLTMLIPKAAVSILQKILPKQGNVRIETNARRASFDAGHFTLSTRQIDERFPNFNDAINLNDANKTVTFSRHDLSAALHRLRLLANTVTPLVTVELTGDSCRLSTSDLDLGRDASEQIPLSVYPHESINISFRLQDLEAILANLPYKELELCMATPNRAAYLMPASPEPDQEILIMVIPYLTTVYA